MKNIFIDTNILLDVIRYREGFYEDASKVWADCESHKVRGFISAISLNNVYYIVRKLVPQDTALTYIRLMLNVFSIVPPCRSKRNALLHATDLTSRTITCRLFPLQNMWGSSGNFIE